MSWKRKKTRRTSKNKSGLSRNAFTSFLFCNLQKGKKKNKVIFKLLSCRMDIGKNAIWWAYKRTLNAFFSSKQLTTCKRQKAAGNSRRAGGTTATAERKGGRQRWNAFAFESMQQRWQAMPIQLVNKLRR